MADVKRKTLMAREDLADRLSVVAKEHGFSLYNLVNEIFESAVQVDDMGANLRRVVEEWRALRVARKVGFILGLESLWYEMADLAYENAKEEALRRWFEAGVWLAKRYVTGEMEKPFDAFKKDLEVFTWNVPEFTIENTGGAVSIRFISPRLPESYTALFEAFLEGALETFGYRIASKEVSTGTIRLEAGSEE